MNFTIMLTEGFTMKHGIIICFITVLTAVTQVYADCVKNEYGKIACGKGQCKSNQYGKAFCAKEGGGAVNSTYGSVLCGVGYCIQDDYNHVWCSKEPGGEARIDYNGKVVCTGGCETGKKSLCEEARFSED
jgi:hypothetical protein